MKRTARGSYYRDESAQPWVVQVSADATGLHLASDALTATWPFAGIIQKTGRYPGEPVRLDHGSEILVIPDRAFLDDLQVYAPQFGQAVRDSGTARSLSLLAGCFLVLVLAAVSVLYLARSSIESAVAAMIPVSVEESLGRAAVAQMSLTKQTCSAEPLNRAVSGIMSRLSAVLEDNPYKFQVSVVDDPSVNAFAAPGGYIVVFRGLLKTTSSPDELAGVLAHEMQHITQRHSLKGIVRSVGIIALISFLAGDVSTVAAAAGHLTGLSFQREDEEAADREGMQALQSARFDAAAMVRAYERLALESGDLPGALQYLSTHPEMKNRVETLKRLAAQSRSQPARMENASKWAEIRESCQ